MLVASYIILCYPRSHVRKFLFPSFLFALIMHSYLEIQRGRQLTNKLYLYFPAIAGRFFQKDSLKHNVFKLFLSQKSFMCFHKRIGNADLYFYWA